MKKALLTLGQIYSDPKIDQNAKKTFLMTYLNKIVSSKLPNKFQLSFNAKRKTELRRIQISKQEFKSQSQKHTDKIFNVIKQKRNNTEETQILGRNMTLLRQNAKKLIEEEQTKAKLYQEKFDSLRKEVDEELIFDPVKSEEVERINKELKAKGEKVTDVIKAMDEDYKQKIEGLRTQCEDQDSNMKDRFAAVKEKSSIVDDLKRDISEMKKEMVPMKLKTNMINNKLSEYESILTNTTDSIVRYKEDTLKIAKKIENYKVQHEEKLKVSEKLKDAVLQVFQENQTLEETLTKEIEKTNAAKKYATLAVAQFTAKKKKQ